MLKRLVFGALMLAGCSSLSPAFAGEFRHLGNLPQSEPWLLQQSIATGHATDSRVLRPTRFLAGIPDVIQMNSWSCGVGVVQSVCMYYGIWGYQDEYAREMGTTSDQGTHPLRITAYLQKSGLKASLREGMTLDQLRKEVDQGHLVIIDYQAWGEPADKDYRQEWEDGHYSLVVGYNDQAIFIEDPSLLGTTGYLKNQEFLDRWHDYEIEGGKRREYVRMAIVVEGKVVPQPRFTHID